MFPLVSVFPTGCSFAAIGPRAGEAFPTDCFFLFFSFLFCPSATGTHAGDTFDGDAMDGVSGELSAHETSSYDTEDYYRGYDDEEEGILQSSLTPGLDSANSYTSDKWQVCQDHSTADTTASALYRTVL